ncbi:FIVAR domain-containing protein [Mycoplasma tullyi]|uniref:FIVAR domain-containing protein n=1 Tax=Mycoplasma tullyi TaxID=1612150 RepID=A0A7D7U1W8_9MOLU|nr:FIVAR domain-containing protein [Mycoplasma tullyi]QMT98269.1 FIVAR domain-containing protein [Mycoplasma tullyi]
MQRKNILKFVSLLGVGSFVMLATASCTQAITPVPKSGTTTADPNTTNPSSSSNDRGASDPMSGADTNPAGDQGIIDPSAQQLATAKKSLTDLLDTETNNVASYSDYAKIQKALKSAYDNAKAATDNTDPTLETLQSAEAALKNAIEKAANDKKEFDDAHQPLVTAYNQLKVTLQSKTTTLEGLSENKYSGIKDYVSNAYTIGSDITSRTLDSIEGTVPEIELIKKANDDIMTALTKLPEWKLNADKYNDFKDELLSRSQLSVGNNATNQNQPSTWSYVGYSVDVSGSSGSNTALSNLNLVQRTVWSSSSGLTSPVASPTSTTNVSWIYSLSGDGTKYTITFDYYGPKNAYLYFPYKLVKNADSSSIALQYKLNDASAESVNFQPVQPAPMNVVVNTDASSPSNPQTRATSETPGANEMSSPTTEMNPTPTVDNINVAKLTLTDLKFGSNTIEFSVPTSKVAPMIGNMYITSNPDSQSKIYDQIFGNTSNTNDNTTSVTVDLLKGYSLAAGWSTYIGQFTNLTHANGSSPASPANTPYYLIGYISGPDQRTVSNSVMNRISTPSTTNEHRTLTIYVNAPIDGDYYISGSYIFSSNTNTMRGLKFLRDGDNAVSLTISKQTNWDTLGDFDSSKADNQNGNSGTVMGTKKTLKLKKGLNKIVISGGSSEQDKTNAPYIGNLTFTLMTIANSEMRMTDQNPSASDAR